MATVLERDPSVAGMTFFQTASQRIQTPEQLGVLLYYKILEVAAQSNQGLTDETADISITATVKRPSLATESEVCGSVCFDVLGHHVGCISVCHTEQ